MSAQTQAPAQYRPTFFRLLRSEFRKLTSLRSTWVISILTIAFYLLIAFFVAQGVDSMSNYWSPAEMEVFTSSYMVTSIFQLALLFGIAFGAMSMTSEYSHNTIQTSLLASRSRLSFYAAKLVVLTIFWGIVSAIALLLSAGLIQMRISAHSVSLPFGDFGFWLSLAACAVVLICGVVMSAGMGAVLRSTVGTTTFMFGIVLVLPILQIIPLDFIEDLTPYFPINLMTAAVQPREEGLASSLVNDLVISDDWLSANGSMLVLIIYATVFIALGAFSLKKRDA